MTYLIPNQSVTIARKSMPTVIIIRTIYLYFTHFKESTIGIPIVRVVVRGLHNDVLRCLHAIFKMLSRTSGHSVELLLERVLCVVVEVDADEFDAFI